MQPWNKRLACIVVAAMALGSVGLFVAGCGDKEKDTKAASELNPCEDELSALCDSPCDATTPCSTGLYCFQGACRADCTPMGGQCSGTCLSDGHCMPASDIATLGGNTGPGGGTGGASASVGMMPGCIQQDVQFESLTPTVELLVDRSKSMNAPFGGGKDRWNTIRDILIDPAMGFVSVTQAKVRFGLTLYTGLNADDPGGPSCANLIQVPILLNNFQPIHDIFVANEVGNNTPTAESVIAVTMKLEAFTEIGPKFIVLATDGDPDTCAAPDSNGTQPPRDDAEAAVQAAFDKGIRTYVIAVGDEIADLNHIQRLAEIGTGGDPNAHYFPAMDANALIDAFGAILGVVISCDFDLNGTVEPANQGSGYVAIDDVAVPYGDPNGWSMTDSDTIRLEGTSCDKVKFAKKIAIQFPCGTVNIQ